jgi:hypothetical protein
MEGFGAFKNRLSSQLIRRVKTATVGGECLDMLSKKAAARRHELSVSISSTRVRQRGLAADVEKDEQGKQMEQRTAQDHVYVVPFEAEGAHTFR